MAVSLLKSTLKDMETAFAVAHVLATLATNSFQPTLVILYLPTQSSVVLVSPKDRCILGELEATLHV